MEAEQNSKGNLHLKVTRCVEIILSRVESGTLPVSHPLIFNSGTVFIPIFASSLKGAVKNPFQIVIVPWNFPPKKEASSAASGIPNQKGNGLPALKKAVHDVIRIGRWRRSPIHSCLHSTSACRKDFLEMVQCRQPKSWRKVPHFPRWRKPPMGLNFSDKLVKTIYPFPTIKGDERGPYCFTQVK